MKNLKKACIGLAMGLMVAVSAIGASAAGSPQNAPKPVATKVTASCSSKAEKGESFTIKVATNKGPTVTKKNISYSIVKGVNYVSKVTVQEGKIIVTLKKNAPKNATIKVKAIAKINGKNQSKIVTTKVVDKTKVTYSATSKNVKKGKSTSFTVKNNQSIGFTDKNLTYKITQNSKYVKKITQKNGKITVTLKSNAKKNKTVKIKLTSTLLGRRFTKTVSVKVK